jgi:uncharacterized protein (DUF302 family)
MIQVGEIHCLSQFCIDDYYNPNNTTMAYQYSKNLRLPFEEVLIKMEDMLQQQGFSMLSSLDVKDHMSRELGVRFRNYVIISACVPELSYRAISLEPHVGILLPCNIVVQQHENGVTEISAINPMEALDQNMVTASLEIIASEISNRLRTAIDSLQTKKVAFSFAYN